MKKILLPRFYGKPTPKVAKELLGKFLVRRYHGRKLAYMITEVEVYDGFNDKGSHASRGKTKRNAPMFGPAGRWYVYFTYGMHWMLNIVTREEEYPAAVLIRGARPVRSGKASNGASGPARLTKKFHINGKLNDLPAAKKSGLWIEDRGVKISPPRIKKSPRVGIEYAGKYWGKKPWRFYLD